MGVKQLQTLLSELDALLATCTRCGRCQSVCPVFSTTRMEGDVTRGKIALLEGLAHQMLTDAGGVKARLDTCLLCGTCEASCPSGVKVMDIFLKARTILTAYEGFSPLKRAVFRGSLSRPRLFSALLGIGVRLQSPFLKTASTFHGTSCSAVARPFLGGRHLVPLADRFLSSRFSNLNKKGKRGAPRVAVFPGCVVDKVYPKIGTDLLKILTHYQTGIILPGHPACCGIPALAAGDRKTFDQLVRYNLERFPADTFDVLVTPCATCTATLKNLWVSLADGFSADAQKQIRALSEKVMDISQFLVDYLNVGAPQNTAVNPLKVTWHDPCHLKKSLGVAVQPRKLIQAIPTLSLVEMAVPDTCCGSGGSFTLQQYDISKQIGLQKADQIVSTGAAVVSTGCPACMMQITDMLSQKGAKIAVKHVVELYADSL
ncbi:MAG: (Fe-S)-binding protein [Deltaproteobacteria bacterium]|nr:MAG: (Fe-S)-binding protein [Deltaproteobacteria bacterium]